MEEKVDRKRETLHSLIQVFHHLFPFLLLKQTFFLLLFVLLLSNEIYLFPSPSVPSR